MRAVNPNECNDIDNELSEKCLTAIQSIIYECPKEIKDTAMDLFNQCMELAVYDP